MKKLSILLIVLSFLTANTSFAQEKEGLKIEGIGQMYINPDIAIISFDLEGSDIEFDKAVDKLNTRINRLHKILKKKDIDKSKINASNYQVSKQYKHDYKNRSKEFIGYKATYNVGVEISSETEEINLIFKTISKEFKEIELRLNFSISDKIKYREELLKLAIEDAKQKAQIISAASGIELGKIEAIEYIDRKAMGVSNREMSLSKSSLDTYVPVEDFSPAKIVKTSTIIMIWNID